MKSKRYIAKFAYGYWRVVDTTTNKYLRSYDRKYFAETTAAALNSKRTEKSLQETIKYLMTKEGYNKVWQKHDEKDWAKLEKLKNKK